MLTYNLLDSFVFPVEYQKKVLSLKGLAKWAKHLFDNKGFNSGAKIPHKLDVYKNGIFIGQVQSIGEACRLTGVNRGSARRYMYLKTEFKNKKGETFLFVEIN